MCDFFHFCTFLCNLLDQFSFLLNLYPVSQHGWQLAAYYTNCYAFYGAHPFPNRSSSFLASRYKKQCRAEITIQFCFGITIPHTLINMKFLVSLGIFFSTHMHYVIQVCTNIPRWNTFLTLKLQWHTPLQFILSFDWVWIESSCYQTRQEHSTSKGSKLLKGAQFRLNPSLFRKAGYVERSKK